MTRRGSDGVARMRVRSREKHARIDPILGRAGVVHVRFMAAVAPGLRAGPACTRTCLASRGGDRLRSYPKASTTRNARKTYDAAGTWAPPEPAGQRRRAQDRRTASAGAGCDIGAVARRD